MQHVSMSSYTDLQGDAVESFSHEDVHQVTGQVVFGGQDHIDVIYRDFPLQRGETQTGVKPSLNTTAKHRNLL